MAMRTYRVFYRMLVKFVAMSDFRALPSVDSVMREPALAGYSERVRGLAAKAAVESARELIRAGTEQTTESVVETATQVAESIAKTTLAPAINMSGVVLHTGLGRARLSASAAEEIAAVAELLRNDKGLNRSLLTSLA